MIYLNHTSFTQSRAYSGNVLSFCLTFAQNVHFSLLFLIPEITVFVRRWCTCVVHSHVCALRFSNMSVRACFYIEHKKGNLKLEDKCYFGFDECSMWRMLLLLEMWNERMVLLSWMNQIQISLVFDVPYNIKTCEWAPAMEKGLFCNNVQISDFQHHLCERTLVAE